VKKIQFILVVFLFQISEKQAQTITDIDGNSYNTITLGAQTWTKENLKTTHFNNGDVIATTTMATNNGPASIYQWLYNYDSLSNAVYGRLYTWYAVVDERNLCPAGWHVPSDTDWDALAIFLGGDSIGGGKMKETGTSHWSGTDVTVTNSSAFTGLPGGFRGNPSGFSSISAVGNFWASTPWGSSSFQRAYTYRLKVGTSDLEQSVAVANCGMSVRCVMDVTTGTENLIPENKIRIFPNPAKDLLHLAFGAPGIFNVSIYNNIGTLVFQKQLTNELNTIDLHFLPQGIYMIKISGVNLALEQKLVIE